MHSTERMIKQTQAAQTQVLPQVGATQKRANAIAAWLSDFLKRAAALGHRARYTTCPVYDNDAFEILESPTRIRHVPAARQERGALAGVYAVAKNDLGENYAEFLSAGEITEMVRRK